MTTKEFIEKLKQDEKDNNLAIFGKIQAEGKNTEAVYAIAKEAGVSDSFENLKAEMRNWYESMSQELSEEDLANIAGGDVGVMEYIYAGCTVAFGAGVGGLF
jgi:predicted ribosomally synthesized peptide with nif11-like leader